MIFDFGLAGLVATRAEASRCEPHYKAYGVGLCNPKSKIQNSVRLRGAGECEEMVPHDRQRYGLAEVVPVAPQ